MRIWLNGSLLDDAMSPAISAIDHGFTVGDGVFETIKLIDGRPFALTRHLARLAASAAGLGLPAPDLALAREGVDAVVRGWGRPTGQLRITYTGGPSPFGSERDDAAPTLSIGLAELAARTPTTGVVTVPWPRNERSALTGLKTTSYAENVVALAYARERRATEALFANTRGEICEGTGSNVFLVIDGRLVTPSLTAGCLAGITRALVLEWCGGGEVTLPMSALHEADEIFITSTKRDVQAVARLDTRSLPAPGPVTREAMDRFARCSTEHIDP